MALSVDAAEFEQFHRFVRRSHLDYYTVALQVFINSSSLVWPNKDPGIIPFNNYLMNEVFFFSNLNMNSGTLLLT